MKLPPKKESNIINLGSLKENLAFIQQARELAKQSNERPFKSIKRDKAHGNDEKMNLNLNINLNINITND